MRSVMPVELASAVVDAGRAGRGDLQPHFAQAIAIDTHDQHRSDLRTRLVHGTQQPLRSLQPLRCRSTIEPTAHHDTAHVGDDARISVSLGSAFRCRTTESLVYSRRLAAVWER